MKEKENVNSKSKLLNYLLIFSCIMFVLSAAWIGVWVFVSKQTTLALDALNLFIKSCSGNIDGADKWFIFAQSAILYSGLFASLVICLISLFSKKYRVIISSLALAISTITFVALLSTFRAFLYSSIYGLFLVFLVVFMFAELAVIYLDLKFTYKFYKKDTKPNVIYQQLVKQQEKPYVSTLDVYQNNIKDEDYDLIFQNSNEYRDYMYHDSIDKYIKEESLNTLQPNDEDHNQSADNQEQNVENVLDITNEKEKNESGFGLKANNYTFEQKLQMAKPVARNYFEDIKTYFEKLGFKYAVTKAGATFSYKNTKYAQITTAGQSGLKIYYKLNVEDYEDSTIPVKDVSDVRKYESIPLLFVVKSDLAVKRAKLLMEDVKSQLG